MACHKDFFELIHESAVVRTTSHRRLAFSLFRIYAILTSWIQRDQVCRLDNIQAMREEQRIWCC
jgi:hypothetical protein